MYYFLNKSIVNINFKFLGYYLFVMIVLHNTCTTYQLDLIMMIKSIATLYFLVLFNICFSQQTNLYPQDFFRSPLDIPLLLAGNFGELRNNHFHSGLDIKTQGVVGQNVRAVADGYVSRIKIMSIGYGKIIFITHANGYTSAYAHLQQFKGKIAEVIKKYQYDHETFEMDYYPPDTLLRVKKGDLIALSGNSGSSGGPHLHFEIRETVSEYAVNPLLFGFDIKDEVKPIIKSIAVFPLNDTSYVNDKTLIQTFKVTGSGGTYKLLENEVINAYGQIGVGINTYDQQTGTSNQNGVYSIVLFDNNDLIYKSELSSFSFNHSRAINSMLDYELYQRKKIRYLRSYIEPNNPLTIFKENKNRGIIQINANENKTINYMVADLNKNTAMVSFSINGKKPDVTNVASIKPKIDTVFKYNDDNVFEKPNIVVKFPKGVLYDDLHFQYQEKKPYSSFIAPLYQIHNGYTPLHSEIQVSIKVARISEELRKKAVVVNIDQNGTMYSRGGEWRNNFLTAKSKILGGFSVMIDTIAPIIKPINIFTNKTMTGNSSITCTMSDNLSGIKTYRGEIDGKWILMDYDGKSAKLTHVFDNLPTGNHTFKLEVTDFVDNKTILEIPFIR